MENIDNIFAAALTHFVDQAKSQRQFASRVGISPPYLNDMLKGRKFGDDPVKRKIAHALGYHGRQFEDFLDVGRYLLAGRDPAEIESDIQGMTGDELRERGFITVPFSDNMRLAAGSGGTIDVTDDVGSSTIVIHAPSIGRTSSRNLQAFRVGGDSMEPEIAQGGIVLADISENNLGRLKEGKIYVLCWEIYEGECAVKYLSWAERDKSVLITSPDNRLHRPIIKHVNEIQLIGRVIWSWREHV